MQPFTPSTPSFEHRCRSRDSCVAKTSDGAAMTMDPDTLCRACVDKLQEQLDSLPEIRRVLPMYVKRSLVPQGGGTPISSSPTPSVPLNVHCLDVMDLVDEALDRAKGLRINDLIRQPATEFSVWTGGRLQQRFLDGVERALQVGKAWKAADEIAGISRAWMRRHAPCPGCNLRTLGQFAGSNTVTCSSCGLSMTSDDYSAELVLADKPKRKNNIES